MPTLISREELLRRLHADEPVALVEALGPDWYADAHLPGARNLPASRADELAGTVLPDREALVVVYCSRTCDESTRLAGRLEELGYTQVRVYSGGKEDWIEAGLPVERGP